MNQQPPDSAPTSHNILGDSPRGFDTPTQFDALTLKARILSGEKVPIEELRAFLLKADTVLNATRVKKALVVKQDDVSFF